MPVRIGERNAARWSPWLFRPSLSLRPTLGGRGLKVRKTAEITRRKRVTGRARKSHISSNAESFSLTNEATASAHIESSARSRLLTPVRNSDTWKPKAAG